MKVLLMGLLMEEAKSSVVNVTIKSKTPRTILQDIVGRMPQIKDYIVRGDGTPRLSTKILVNGLPPASLDQAIADDDVVSIAALRSCDG